MKKIYFLKTCDTNMRILKSINLDGFELQEIKTNPITVEELDEMQKLSGSYEALFSRRAKKYKQMDLKNQELSEKDYRQLIIDEYTFLKRPVIIIDDKIFIGNSKKNVENLQAAIN
ncbi:MAG: arsenate reductase [Flavobacteriaceae bacterium]|nr:MAG: arsenate reductase [Flavobacteriaceae bacterium]